MSGAPQTVLATLTINCLPFGNFQNFPKNSKCGL